MPESLLRRVATGDLTAVDEVLDRYGGLVWSLARRFSATPTDAEDASQEVFIDLWRSAPRFDEEVATEPAFVAMIARRRLVDRFRQLQRRPTKTTLPANLVTNESGPEERAQRSDELARVSEAMANLRPEQQQVLKLALYGGLTQEEISQSTGLPLGTVKTHARRGLLRIRELIGRSPSTTQEETA